MKRRVSLLAVAAFLALPAHGLGAPERRLPRKRFAIRHRFVEVASDRSGYRRLRGHTDGLTFRGTLLGELPENVHAPHGSYVGIALGTTVLYFAPDFTYVGHDGDSELYISHDVDVPPSLMRR